MNTQSSRRAWHSLSYVHLSESPAPVKASIRLLSFCGKMEKSGPGLGMHLGVNYHSSIYNAPNMRAMQIEREKQLA